MFYPPPSSPKAIYSPFKSKQTLNDFIRNDLRDEIICKCPSLFTDDDEQMDVRRAK